MEYNFYYIWNEQFILISKEVNCSLFNPKNFEFKELIKVKYRCQDYLKIKGTSKRISIKTIKKNIKPCDIIA